MAKLTHGKVTDFQPDPHNANQGTMRGLRLLEDSLRESGAGRSLLADKNGVLIAGNKTAQSAADIGLDDALIVETDGTQVVIVKRTDLDINTPEGRAMAYRDNRVGEIDLAWEPAQLIADMQAGVFPEGLFETEELEALIAAVKDELPDDPGAQVDKAAELQVKWKVERGQVWQIGKHRLMCGDSTSREDVGRLMDGAKIDILINDPPYGMRLAADFSGMVNHLDFARVKGVKNGHRYDNVTGDHEDYNAAPIRDIFQDVKEQFWFGADYYAATLGDTAHSGAWLVWDKRLDESADKMYGSCFELVWSQQKHKRDMLRHKWAGIFSSEHESQRGRSHPNQKPTPLIADIINRYTNPNALIVDCYCGSGTTIVAAEQTGRICYGMEIEPKYCAVTLDRLVRMGLEPRLISNTQEF